MNRTRSLRHALAALACAAIAQAAVAQDNPATGKTLFENTPVASGQAMLQRCTQCHLTVQNRRDAIDPGGDLDFDLVFARFTTAISVQVVAMGQFNALSTQQKRDIAAYIADVPKARPNLVDFTASALNTETAATQIAFSNAVTATAPLTITSVGVTGATDFLIKTPGTTCGTSVVLQPGQSCVVSVTFRTATAGTKVSLLEIAYSQGGVPTTRSAQLSGSVAATPGGGGGGSSSGGGGALPPVALGLVLLALAVRRRR